MREMRNLSVDEIFPCGHFDEQCRRIHGVRRYRQKEDYTYAVGGAVGLGVHQERSAVN